MKFFFSATRRRDIKILLSVGPHTEKFYIVMNDHGRTHKCDFSVFDQKYFKIASLSWNSNSNIQNSVVMFTFSVFFFLAKLGPKNQNYQFKLKFGTWTNSNMQNSMVVSILFLVDWKYPFWTNLIQKIKIDSLSSNLVLRLIWKCRIQWWCSLFLF